MTQPITIFVCGPTLRGEVLTGLTVQGGAVIWEGGAEPAPHPAEPIQAVHYLPVGERLVILLTEAGLYLTTVDDLVPQPF